MSDAGDRPEPGGEQQNGAPLVRSAPRVTRNLIALTQAITTTRSTWRGFVLPSFTPQVPDGLYPGETVQNVGVLWGGPVGVAGSSG
jgi:hypothetical protein